MTDIPIISRDILARHFGDDKRMIAAFEDMNAGAAEAQTASVSNVEATAALQDATVIVLSANDAFTNERVLKLADGLEAVVDADFVTIQLTGVARAQNYGVILIANGETQLTLPLSGTLVAFENAGAHLSDFVNDAAAATGGVPVAGLYRNGSVVMVRVA